MYGLDFLTLNYRLNNSGSYVVNNIEHLCKVQNYHPSRLFRKAFSIKTIFVVFRVIVVLSIQVFLYDLIVMEVVDWFHVAHPLQPPAVLQLRAHSCKKFHVGRYTMATAIST